MYQASDLEREVKKEIPLTNRMWTGFSVSSLLLACCTAHTYGAQWEEGLAQKINGNGVATATQHNQWNLLAIPYEKRDNAVRHRLAQQGKSAHSNHVAEKWVQEIEAPVHKRLSTLAERICWDDGISCEADTTCINCCAGIWYSTADGEFCGTEAENCLEDGTVCFEGNNDYSYMCWKCCNGAYENRGTTCGGQCSTSGTVCDIDSTCMTCCNYTYYKVGNDDSYQCGCMEDGTKCIPGEDCYYCCNGAYDDDGTTCGGTCIPDKTECSYGEDCHLCCTYSSYWYSTGKMHCGQEPCYADGESCIPGQNCYNCCSGGAYDGDGTICGGECLPRGSECNFLSTCNKCCPDYGYMGFPFPLLPSNSTTEVSLSPSMSPSSTFFPNYGGSPSSYWDATAGSMVCGYPTCLEDGTSCIPGYSCGNCCNGAYNDGGTTCGGKCLETGSKCEYYSTCNTCCTWPTFNATLGSYVCQDYYGGYGGYNDDYFGGNSTDDSV